MRVKFKCILCEPSPSGTGVVTPGVSIVVQGHGTDPAGNPEIWVDTSATDPDTGAIDPPTSASDPNLVPVKVNVPLGADQFGTATLTWSPSIRLYSRASSGSLTQVGGLGYYGQYFQMTWNVSSGLASQTFYAQAVSVSGSLGDRSFSLQTALSFLASPNGTNPDPSTSPSAYRAATALDCTISGDCNDDGVVNGQDDAVKATLPVILNLDDQTNGKGLFIHAEPTGSVVYAEIVLSNAGIVRIEGAFEAKESPAHGSPYVVLNPANLTNGEWIQVFAEENGSLTATLTELFAGGGQRSDVIKLRVVRADMIFRNGSMALAAAIDLSVTHGGIDTGDDKIYDLDPAGWKSDTAAAFYQGHAAVKERLSFNGSYMADRIRAQLFDNLRNGAVDYPTGTPRWDIFSNADNFTTANCLEMAEKQWELAIRNVRAQLTDPAQIAAFEAAYFSGGSVKAVVQPDQFVFDGGLLSAAVTAAAALGALDGCSPSDWSWSPEPADTDFTFDPQGHLQTTVTLHIITPKSYMDSSLFEEIPY